MIRSRLLAILPLAAAMMLSTACASGGKEETGTTGEAGRVSDTTMTNRARPDTMGAMGVDTTMGMDTTGAGAQ